MPYDCTEDVMAHKREVNFWMSRFGHMLYTRGDAHDNSKLKPPEKAIFDQYTWRLRQTAFGSPEYKAQLAGMGEGLKHHYAVNSHHPEHFPNGVNDMHILDVVEMVCDWIAAAHRQNAPVDLTHLTERFNLSPQLAQIISNTLVQEGIASK